jgi:hypothetical protein
MDEDIADMAKRLEALPAAGNQSATVRGAIEEALSHPQFRTMACGHTPLTRFVRGKDLTIELLVKQKVSARLYYRHVNQSEHFQSAEMQSQAGKFQGTIPGNYTDTAYPLQYYFELRQGSKDAWLYPGLNRDLTNQPYFVVRSV